MMTPDKQWADKWPVCAMIMAVSKEAVDNLSHKGAIALAVAILSAMIYWGFSRTFSQIDRVENHLDTFGNRQIEVIKNQGEFKSELARIEQSVKDHISQTERIHSDRPK
jgi:hypothetical protein